MSQAPALFLDRETELARLQTLLRKGKSLLLYGPAGIGKSTLLAELHQRRQAEFPALLFSSGLLKPVVWSRQLVLDLAVQSSSRSLREQLRLAPQAGPADVRVALSRRHAGALREILTIALKDSSHAVVLDPLGFVSQSFFELLHDLKRMTHTPLVLVARSPHMEDIGYATRFYWPREQRLCLGPLGSEGAVRLFETALAAWPRRPDNLETFREHALNYAAGNPGVLLGLLGLGQKSTYWTGNRLKVHLLTVDFNVGSASASASSRI